MRRRERDSLLQQFVDGDLDEADCAQAVALLKADPEAFECFCEYAELDAGLKYLSSGAARITGGHPSLSLQARDREVWRARLIAVMAAAASVALFAGALYLTLAPKLPPNLAFRTAPETHYQITHLASGKEAPALGTLEPGSKLLLDQGSVELKFASGVRAVIEAPADLNFIDKSRLLLTEGSGFFEVPPGAEGFTVSTAELEIIDLGTEFAVLATKNAGDQVHVIKGRVKAVNRNGLKSSEILIAGQAREAGPTGRLNTLPLRAADFTRTLPTTLPYLHWSFDGHDPLRPTGTLPGASSITAHTEGGDPTVSKQRRVPGVSGSAMKFEGPESQIVTSWQGFTSRTPRSLTCWIRLDPHQPDSWQSIVEWGATTYKTINTYWRVRTVVDPATGNCILRLSYGKNWTDGSIHLADGNWRHLAITESREVDEDGNPEVRFFVDGVEDANTRRNQDLTYRVDTRRGYPLSIGRAVESMGFYGALDEIFIFKGVLSQEAIRGLIDSSRPQR